MYVYSGLFIKLPSGKGKDGGAVSIGVSHSVIPRFSHFDATKI